jgi:hypothetical protein
MTDLVLRGMIWELDQQIQDQTKLVHEAQEHLTNLTSARERLRALDGVPGTTTLTPEPPEEEEPVLGKRERLAIERKEKARR